MGPNPGMGRPGTVVVGTLVVPLAVAIWARTGWFDESEPGDKPRARSVVGSAIGVGSVDRRPHRRSRWQLPPARRDRLRWRERAPNDPKAVLPSGLVLGGVGFGPLGFMVVTLPRS